MKIFCEILHIPPPILTAAFVIAFVGVIFVNASDLVYFSVKVFFHSICTIFFSSIEVLGQENIPQHGPVIFTGNHTNQFVDGAVVIVTTPRRVGFLVAEKSYNKRVIGDFCKAAGAIPVSRPQDTARPGTGKIRFDNLTIHGEGTKFLSLQKGEKIRPGRSPEVYRLVKALSDTEGVLAEDIGDASPCNDQHAADWVSYDILTAVDQSNMFHSVQAALANGQCLGIFPEGGSHDRTDLLPLKAGVAAIALGVADAHGVFVPIVPVGLNYFRGHRFRGRVVVEFGEPVHITEELLAIYRKSKRQAYQLLLHEIETSMRSVIVTAADYQELKLIHTARRLFPYNAAKLSTQTKLDLARRFSYAWKLIKEKYHYPAQSELLPEDLVSLQGHLIAYQDALDHWGLKDYQLLSKLDLSFAHLLYTFLHGLIIVSLASIPSILLNLPVGILASYWASMEAKKDLKVSRVKITARDVLLSKKIQFSLLAVPTLWVIYALLLFFLTNLPLKTILVVILSCPFFSYLGVMAVETSLVDLKDLRPAFLRLLPEYRKKMPELMKQRAELQKEVQGIVHKYGPQLGAVYTDTTRQWEQAMRKQRVLGDSADADAAENKEGKEAQESRPIDTSIALMDVEGAREDVDEDKKDE